MNKPGEPEVSLVLSRRAYRSGDTLCGTVRLYLKDEDQSGVDAKDSCSFNSVDAQSDASTAVHHNLSGSSENISVSEENGDGKTTEAQWEHKKRMRHEPYQRILREHYFESATVHVAGHCRVDTRWHPLSSSKLQQLYGETHPLLAELPPETSAYLKDIDIPQHPPSRSGSKLQQNSVVVCHFATNCLQLSDLQERVEPYRGKEVRVTLEDLKNDHFYQKLKKSKI